MIVAIICPQSAQVLASSQGAVTAFATRESGLITRWLGVKRLLEQNLSQQDYDLVVSHFALYTAPIVNQLTDRPLVMHFQGPWALEGQMEGGRSLATQGKKMVEHWAYRQVSKFIVLSEAFKQVLHREYQVPLEKIHVIPAGVDGDRFRLASTPAAARAQLNWPANRPIIFAARRLAKRMGLENLIEAMKMVQAQHPEAILYIAGKGAQQAALAQQIEALGLADCVKLLGFVSDEDLLLAYRAADFSVVPTVAYEGFGLIVIESLAMGTPVLGTPVDAIPEILQPLSPAMLFAGSTAADIAAGIGEVLAGDRVLPSAADCQAYVAANYDWSVIAPQIKAVYQLALA
jgi:glycosyltransferase involved in cell wall biosynthesis